MKALNKKPSQIFESLIQGLEKPGDSAKYDNGGESVMAASVECIGECKHGLIFSIAHYWKHNTGDMMRDPDITFLRTQPGHIIPLSFRQDPGIYQESVFMQADGNWKYKPRQQKDHTVFANQWLKNIAQQQDIKPLQPA